MTTNTKIVSAIVGVSSLIGLSTLSNSDTEPSKTTSSNCHPSYSKCLRINAGDYDCAGGSGNGPNYTGKVRVTGSDPFGLDRDNDGWGCE